MSLLELSNGVVAFASSALLMMVLRYRTKESSCDKIFLSDNEAKSKQHKSKQHSQAAQAQQFKYTGVYVELVLPIYQLGRAQILLNNDAILTRAVKDAGESIYVYILDESPDEECVINSAEMFNYMSDVYSQLWDEMVSQKKMHLSCAVVCDAVDPAFNAPAGLYSQSCIQAIYSTNLPPIRSATINSIRASAGMDDPLAFEQCALPQPVKQQFEDCYYVDSGRIGGSPVALPVFNTVAVGGTFDRLHNGHRKLLTLGAGLCKETLVVGIMSDELLKKKALAELIQPFEQRAKVVVDFLAVIKPQLQVSIFQLKDPYGPTITDKSIEALVVSSETQSGVRKINEIRKEKEYPPLVGLVVRRDDISILSSTFVRECCIEI